jgi:hypothetical protein
MEMVVVLVKGQWIAPVPALKPLANARLLKM